MKAIIFDLDGTMVDNMMVHHRAWQKTLKELGLEMTLEQVIANMHGVNEEALKKVFGDRFNMEELIEISHRKESRYRSIFLSKLKLINGLEKLLEDCHRADIPLAVATAAPQVNLDFVIDNLNIRGRFKSVLHSGNVAKGKPHPEVFLKSAEALQVQPHDCLVFEDSPTGIKTANNAGMDAIAITTSHPEKDFDGLKVKKFITDYTELNLQRLLQEQPV